jgi:FdhD protein
VETRVERFTGLENGPETEVLAVEEPLEIQLGYGPAASRKVKSVCVTMRTPGNDFELAAGFLIGEGVVRDSADIVETAYATGSRDAPGEQGRVLPYRPEQNIVRVELASDVVVAVANLERNFYATSSCGICGKASLLALRTVCPARVANCFEFPAGLLYSLPSRLRESQGLFERTGGLHAAGLFDAAGELLSIREDIGRHNAVDKLLGAEFLADRTPLRDRLLMLSGRASFELLQKAVVGGVPMVVSVGAPSTLAVEVAREFDITLAGFLRADHFNVYQGAERVV